MASAVASVCNASCTGVQEGSWIGRPHSGQGAALRPVGWPIHEPSCTPVHESLQTEATADAMKPPGGGS